MLRLETPETLRRRDHNSKVPSQVKLVRDNASSRRDIDFIYDVLLKWFEERLANHHGYAQKGGDSLRRESLDG